MGGHFNAVEIARESATSLAASSDPTSLLSDRQLVVFTFQAHGRTLTAAAQILGISRETVHLEARRLREILRRAPRGRVITLRCRRCGDEPKLPGRGVGRLCFNERRRPAERRRWSRRAALRTPTPHTSPESAE